MPRPEPDYYVVAVKPDAKHREYVPAADLTRAIMDLFARGFVKVNAERAAMLRDDS